MSADDAANGIIIGWAVAGAIGVVGSVLWAITDPDRWDEWRESLRRVPSDPAVRSEPAPRAPDAPPRPRR